MILRIIHHLFVMKRVFAIDLAPVTWEVISPTATIILYIAFLATFVSSTFLPPIEHTRDFYYKAAAHFALGGVFALLAFYRLFTDVIRPFRTQDPAKSE
jgi:hypothetical protein